ncbi:bifunctional diaminohydroxyphosphoribosylaminopyrimidine deaminase/5-amino-6-(5-phosphoribosylamino)uracil reductase RibD [Lachnospiraceae bacterium]|nr:bifunctional diaminohydroxyphosphoribosylaminopyrimidine deaminase/5-amino-6-(5-phosphoribosylamino)uracil reductase RibD [Lachnospiraceae bacterium]
MRMALALAGKAEGKVSPNPMVGCVVVKEGRVIASGYHESYGGYHAERNALLHCQEDTEGAELYVNLEPCCHYGKTPPCTDIILEKKLKKVYVGCLDPNPKVAGKGIKILREHGVEVETGILEEECRMFNEVFFHYMTEKMPFTAMKYAMTLDGKIACETGDSKWVTGTEARAQVQRLRNRYRGIMAGIGTVLKDDPLLNCRMEGGKNPVRIICDSRLRIPANSQIVKTAGEIETVVAWNPQAAESYHSESGHGIKGLQELRAYLEGRGIELLEVPLYTDAAVLGLDLRRLFAKLGEREIDSVLLEGGGTLNASALRERLVQRVYAFIAPKLVAGAEAKSPVEGEGICTMKDAVKLSKIQIASFGEDFCISGRIGEEELCLPES